MNLSLIAMAIITVAVGIGIALQAAVNAALARHVGTIEATLVSVTITWLFVATLLFTGLRRGSLGQVLSVPPYLLIGGFLGAAILITAITVVPRLGAGGLIAAFVVGQLIGSLVLDHFGAFGLRQIPVTPGRLVGAALLLAGMRLIVR